MQKITKNCNYSISSSFTGLGLVLRLSIKIVMKYPNLIAYDIVESDSTAQI